MSEPLTVSEFCSRLSGAIDDAFPHELWVSGAISGLSRSASGHVYFDLIETGGQGATPTAIVPVALFAQAKLRVNAILRKSGHVRMADGVEINIRGKVAHYPKSGRLQLIMSLIDPAFTLGRLAESREATMRALAAEGLLELQAQLDFPAMPLRVALVTSAGSAAEADFCNELANSGWHFDITLFDSRVQGEAAPAAIAQAIADASTSNAHAVAVVRGGGAKTDLVAFDHPDVARAVARCQKPVVVGVGHEIDRSIVDDVAYCSTKTPTAAAGVFVDAITAFEQRVHRCGQRITVSARRHGELSHQRLGTLSTRFVAAASGVTTVETHRLSLLTSKLSSGSKQTVERLRHQQQQAQLRVNAVDPAVLMRRGWTVTRSAAGHLVRSVNELAPGDTIVTSLIDGEVKSDVQ